MPSFGAVRWGAAGVVVGVLWVSSATAAPLRATSTSWGPDALALRLGIGTAYGVVGGHLGAAWQLRHSLSLGVYGGAGLWPGEEQAEAQPLFAAGVQGRWGSSHRLLLDVGYEMLGLQKYRLHTVTVAQDLEYGLGLRLGYEYQADSGLNVQLGLGPGWLPGIGAQWVAAAALAVGYRWGLGS